MLSSRATRVAIAIYLLSILCICIRRVATSASHDRARYKIPFPTIRRRPKRPFKRADDLSSVLHFSNSGPRCSETLAVSLRIVHERDTSCKCLAQPSRHLTATVTSISRSRHRKSRTYDATGSVNLVDAPNSHQRRRSPTATYTHPPSSASQLHDAACRTVPPCTTADRLRQGRRRWSAGHPWIYRSDVIERPDAAAGAVRVVDQRGKPTRRRPLEPDVRDLAPPARPRPGRHASTQRGGTAALGTRHRAARRTRARDATPTGSCTAKATHSHRSSATATTAGSSSSS